MRASVQSHAYNRTRLPAHVQSFSHACERVWAWFGLQEGSGEEKAEAPLTPTEAKEAAGDEYKTPKMEEAEAEARVEESKEELIDMGMEEVDAEEGAIAKEALKAE
eukprot:5052114-Pleurochrysis_carterae.AAC.4